MVYGDFKHLPGITASNELLRNKALNIAKNRGHDGYKHGLATTANKYFDKKSPGANTSGSAVTRSNKSAIKSEFMPNQKLAKKWHKQIIRTFEKCILIL